MPYLATSRLRLHREVSMIDLTQEKPVPLDEAAKLFPPARGGQRCHLSTVLRWILKGSRGPNGERVRLEATRLGGRWMTSREAIQRFAERLTPDLEASGETATTRTPTKRRRSSEAARRRLTA